MIAPTVNRGTLEVSITRCARCHGYHPKLPFTLLLNPSDDWKYWAPCPKTGQPILLRISTAFDSDTVHLA